VPKGLVEIEAVAAKRTADAAEVFTVEEMRRLPAAVLAELDEDFLTVGWTPSGLSWPGNIYC